MKDNLKHALKDHYQDKNLSQDKVQKLLSIHEHESSSLRIIGPLGALVTACLVVILYQNITTPINQKVAKEVSYNHSKKMPSEVLTSDYSLINEALDRLHFKVKESQKLKGMLLVGARYCSVQGETAAQIQLKETQSNKHYTLYQFKISKATKELTPSTIEKDNVRVKVWIEGDIGFALAEDL